MANSASASSGVALPPLEPTSITLIHDSLTFENRQLKGLRDMERQAESELKLKRREWERDVEKMREEFLKLHRTDRVWGSDELLDDPLVAKRRGSTDILNVKKMRTLYTETPDSEHRKLRLRFDLRGFDPDSVRVSSDSDRIVVRATKMMVDTPSGVPVKRDFNRKIQKPRDVDPTRLKSRLTSDGILLVEAPTIPKQPPPTQAPGGSLAATKKSGPSPSHSFHGSARSKSPTGPGGIAGVAGGGCTPAGSPPSGKGAGAGGHPEVKLGIPTFREENGHRRMHLVVEVGPMFKPKDITIQVIKENRIVVKAKHEERTSERLSKNKYSREFELPEKIEAYSIRGGLTPDGQLVVGAFVKGFGGPDVTRENAGQIIIEEIDPHSDLLPCNILNLASFPPTMPASAAATPLAAPANGS